MSRTRHRRKVKKTLVVVSNDINRTEHQHSLSRVVFLAIFVLLLCCAGVAYVCFYVDRVTLESAQSSQQELKDEIAELKVEQSTLEKENTELSEKNAIMSVTLEELAQYKETREAEDALAYVPTGLPANKVSGMQEILGDGTIPDIVTESYTNEDGEVVIPQELADLIVSATNPIVIFTLQEGSQVMAVADGTVIDATDDVDYGHMVRIDHGNGYVSVYRCSLPIAVNVGDKIEKGTLLYEVAEGEVTLGYQIILNAEYMNPMDIMELKG